MNTLLLLLLLLLLMCFTSWIFVCRALQLSPLMWNQYCYLWWFWSDFQMFSNFFVIWSTLQRSGDWIVMCWSIQDVLWYSRSCSCAMWSIISSSWSSSVGWCFFPRIDWWWSCSELAAVCLLRDHKWTSGWLWCSVLWSELRMRWREIDDWLAMSTALFHDALLLNCICIMNSEAFSNLLNKKTFDQTHLQLSSVITRRAWSVDLVLQQYQLSSPCYIYARDHCSFPHTTCMAITTCWSSACLSVLLLVILMTAVMILNRTDPFQPAPGKEWVRPAFPFNTSWSDRSMH